MDSSSLPPCSAVMLQTLKRTNYVCSIWLNAYAHSPQFLPIESGWNLDNECYRIKWFEGKASPTTVTEICNDNQDSDLEEEINSSSSSDSDLSEDDIDRFTVTR